MYTSTLIESCFCSRVFAITLLLNKSFWAVSCVEKIVLMIISLSHNKIKLSMKATCPFSPQLLKSLSSSVPLWVGFQFGALQNLQGFVICWFFSRTKSFHLLCWFFFYFFFLVWNQCYRCIFFGFFFCMFFVSSFQKFSLVQVSFRSLVFLGVLFPQLRSWLLK